MSLRDETCPADVIASLRSDENKLWDFFWCLAATAPLTLMYSRSILMS